MIKLVHEALENAVLHSIAGPSSQSVDVGPFSQRGELRLLPQRVL